MWNDYFALDLEFRSYWKTNLLSDSSSVSKGLWTATFSKITRHRSAQMSSLHWDRELLLMRSDVFLCSLANNQYFLLSVWAWSITPLTKHFIIIDKLCDTLLRHEMIPMTALNVLRLMSFLTSSNNPLTYFIDSMSHTRQSASALAAKVETLLKLADLRGNRTPTLAYFVMPLSYLLSHSSPILPFASPLYFSCCFPVPTALFRARRQQPY